MPLLDIGQPGGARDLGGTATFTLKADPPGEDESIVIEHQPVQVSGIFEDNLGYAGSRVVWRGRLTVVNNAMLRTIALELNRLKHGQTRDSNGNLLPVNPTLLRETQLTDFDGTVLAQRARLRRWSFGPPREFVGSGRIAIPLEVEFRIL